MSNGTEMNSIDEILEDLKAGRMIVLVDDESRENEGDLVCAAEKVTPEIINFMRKHAGGQICLPMTNARADQLALYPQASDNTSRFGTAFTVSVDASTGVTTNMPQSSRCDIYSLDRCALTVKCVTSAGTKNHHVRGTTH